jgi:hypothetical protein
MSKRNKKLGYIKRLAAKSAIVELDKAHDHIQSALEIITEVFGEEAGMDLLDAQMSLVDDMMELVDEHDLEDWFDGQGLG